MVILPHVLGCLFNLFAARSAKRSITLLEFGNNRNKLYTEQRKTRQILTYRFHVKALLSRKAKWILLTSLISTCVPQIIVALAKVTFGGNFHRTRLLINQLFMTKCIANFVMYYHQMIRLDRGVYSVVYYLS